MRKRILNKSCLGLAALYCGFTFSGELVTMLLANAAATREIDQFCKKEPGICDDYVPAHPYSKGDSLHDVHERLSSTMIWIFSTIGSATMALTLSTVSGMCAPSESSRGGYSSIGDDVSDSGVSRRSIKAKDIGMMGFAACLFAGIAIIGLMANAGFMSDVICPTNADGDPEVSVPSGPPCNATFPTISYAERKKVEDLADDVFNKMMQVGSASVGVASILVAIFGGLGAVAIKELMGRCCVNGGVFKGRVPEEDGENPALAFGMSDGGHHHGFGTL